jgi:hypothetical protein
MQVRTVVGGRGIHTPSLVVALREGSSPWASIAQGLGRGSGSGSGSGQGGKVGKVGKGGRVLRDW